MRDESGLLETGLARLLWIRQVLACGLVLLLSARIPTHLLGLITCLRSHGGWTAAGEALLLPGVDGFGLLCALYFSHERLRGRALLRCYPPNRLIPLSSHLLGLLFGLVRVGAGF